MARACDASCRLSELYEVIIEVISCCDSDVTNGLWPALRALISSRYEISPEPSGSSERKIVCATAPNPVSSHA